jgi:CheY-like chemotaxis protein
MQPKKVLVIDDSTLIHKLFRLIFDKTALVFANDGVEAQQRMAEHPDIDLVFLDINMPRMNGLELLARIKLDAGLASIPVVIISTEGKEADVIRGLKTGAAAYVKKPFRNEEVLGLVTRLA